MRNLIQHRTPVAVLLGLTVFAVLAGARWVGWLQPPELAMYDWLVRTTSSEAEEPRIVVVGVTEADIARLGTWPTPHGVLAAALGKLLAMDPVAVGLDIYLDVPVPPGREALDALLTADPRLISVMKFGDGAGTAIPPAPVHVDGERVGFTDTLLDDDATVRRALLFLDNDEGFSLSLAFQVALRFLERHGIGPSPDPEDPAVMRLGSVSFFPLEGSEGAYQRIDAGGYQFLSDYRARPEAFRHFSLFEVLDDAVPAAEVAGKIVLMGVTADSVKDLFFTPHSAGDGARQTPGVVVHAQVASQLLRAALEGQAPLASVSELAEYAWLLCWVFAGTLLALRVRAPSALALAGLVGLGAIGGVGWAAFVHSLWVPVVPPAMGWLLTILGTSAYLSALERQERQSLMSLFSKHVSPQLANAIWAERDRFLSNNRPVPQRLVATAFFSDVASFTTISEALDPPQLMDWLNEYMALMAPRINEHDGVILRFIGDAIMAVFGVPVARTEEVQMRRDASNAVRCALSMQAHLMRHNRSLAERGLPMVGMRIGIFTGEMVAGTIGSDERLEYNVHGDTVNTAARLESFQKENFEPDHLERPCRILVGALTVEYLGDAFELEKVGEVALKGKTQPVAVYTVLGERPGSAASIEGAAGVRK